MSVIPMVNLRYDTFGDMGHQYKIVFEDFRIGFDCISHRQSRLLLVGKCPVLRTCVLGRVELRPVMVVLIFIFLNHCTQTQPIPCQNSI